MKRPDLHRRMMLYGTGGTLAGLIIAVCGPTSTSTSPSQPRPDHLWITVPGWIICGAGTLLLFSGVILSMFHSGHRPARPEQK